MTGPQSFNDMSECQKLIGSVFAIHIMHLQTLTHTEKRLHRGNYYQNCMHASMHAVKQQTQNSDTSRSFRQVEILELSLVCSLVFESSPADTC